MLNNVNVPVECLVCPCGCESVNHRISIDNYYNGIVLALHSAAHHTVPVLLCSALKAFWSAEFDSLKSDSVFGTKYGMKQAGHRAEFYIELRQVVNWSKSWPLKRHLWPMIMQTLMSWLTTFWIKIFLIFGRLSITTVPTVSTLQKSVNHNL